MSGAWISAPRPKPWKIGNTARTMSDSPSPTHAASSSPSLMKFWCDSMIPLGDPVVPPEKRIAARSWVSTRARRRRRMLLRHQPRPPLHVGVRRDARDLAPARQPEPEPLRRREAVGDAGEDESLEPRPRADLRKGAVERVERQRDARTAQVQVPLDLARSGEGMDHGGDGSELPGGVEGDHGLRRGRHRDRDPVARAEPERGEPVRAPVDRLAQLAVGRRRAQEVVGDRVGRPSDGRHHGVDHGHLRVVERRRDLAVVAQPRAGRAHGSRTLRAAGSAGASSGGSKAAGSSR